MHQSFGARLRQRREDQGIALATIAEGTKIKLSLLESLERDDVSHWPSGIFRRAYIRTYAQAIGLNPDVVVREFLEAHPEPLEEFETALATALSTGVRANSGPPTRLRNIVGSALGSLSRLRRPAPAAESMSAAEIRTIDPPAVPMEILAVHPPEAAAIIEMANDAAVEDPPSMDVASEHGHAPQETVVVPAASRIPDLAEIARLCTEFGRFDNAEDVQAHLRDASCVLDAVGLIVWIWDADASGLRPALAHGYSERVLAQLPTVSPEADNVTAAAFRSETPATMTGGRHASDALVLPLLTPSGCVGVLALELPPGAAMKEGLCAVAEILAAAIAQLVDRACRVDVEAEPVAPLLRAHAGVRS